MITLAENHYKKINQKLKLIKVEFLKKLIKILIKLKISEL